MAGGDELDGAGSRLKLREVLVADAMTGTLKHRGTCANARCPLRQGPTRGQFESEHPATYCSARCRGQAAYDRKRERRLRELGLVS